MTLGKPFFTSGMLVPLAIGLLWVAPALAQQRAVVGQQIPVYDMNTETRLIGAVEEVIIKSGYMGTLGTYLLMSFGSETIEVHLGPATFLKQKYIEVIAGEMLEVIGSRVKIGESDALIAREIRNWEEMRWTFRDDSGQPLWTRSEPH